MLGLARGVPLARGLQCAVRWSSIAMPHTPEEAFLRRRKVVRRVRVKRARAMPGAKLRDPASMVVEEVDEPAEGEITWGTQRRGSPRVKRARRSLEEVLADMLTGSSARGEEYLSDEILQRLTEEGFTLADEHVAQLVSHCIASKTRHHGALTLRMFDDVLDEAQEVLATAERLGHEVGPESMCVFICVLANPSQGSARDLDRAVDLLEEHFDNEDGDAGGAAPTAHESAARSLGFAHAPAWVYETVLRGAAMDDNEEAAVRVVVDLRGQEHISSEGWAYALSSCNRAATVKSLRRVMEERGVVLGTEHYTAVLKCCAKAKAFGFAESVISEMEERGIAFSADTYAAWMATKASAGDADGAKRVYNRLLTELEDGDISADLVSSLLHLCLVHAKNVGDVYAELARELYAGSVRVGLHCDHRLATKALWVFTSVGDEEYAKKVADSTRGSSIEGHHFEMLKEARYNAGNLRDAMFMDEAELEKRGIAYDVTGYSTAKGYKLKPAKTREHGLGRRTPETATDVSNLAMQPLPSTPKGM